MQYFEVRRLTLSTTILRRMATALLLASACVGLRAQISLGTVVDMALKASPKVRIAQADLNRASAAYRQTRSAFIPTLYAGSGLGYTYGFPVGQPTLFNFTSQSLVFDASQFSYLRANHAAIQSATLALQQARQLAEEDAAISYIRLDAALSRQAAMHDAAVAADRLTAIEQQRVDAGLDAPMELTRAKLTAAQVRLKQVHLDSEVAGERAHLAQITGLDAANIATIPVSIPPAPGASVYLDNKAVPLAVQAAFANATAKQQQAVGDHRQTWLPQLMFAAQYARFASFNNYQDYYGNQGSVGGEKPFQFNNAALGMQFSWPIFDRTRKARADMSAADAAHALGEANLARDTAAEATIKLNSGLQELALRQQVAELERDLAQQQLDAVTVQASLGPANTSTPPPTPRDEQNARIAAAQQRLVLAEATLDLRQAQLDLLVATGNIESWIRSVAAPAAKQ